VRQGEIMNDFTIDEQAGAGGNTYDVTVIHD
jgi:hypothetical protein